MRFQAQRLLADALKNVGVEMSNATGETLSESVQSLAKFMGIMQEAPGPLDNRSVVQGIVDQHRLRLEEMRFRSAASVAPYVDGRIQKQLSKMKPTITTLSDIQFAIGDVTDQSWGNVERVVRTETAHAFNTAQVEGILLLEDDYPGMMKRWT